MRERKIELSIDEKEYLNIYPFEDLDKRIIQYKITDIDKNNTFFYTFKLSEFYAIIETKEKEISWLKKYLSWGSSSAIKNFKVERRIINYDE